jgi:hypothetical protein
MSQPPGGYQPPGAPPPAGPPGGPPPPPSAYPPPAYQPGYSKATRPGGVTAASVLLIILGALTAIGGILIMVGGGAVAGTFGGGFGGVIIVLGLLALAFAVFEIISGIKILGLNPGWRITGIVLCAVGGVFSLISLIGSFSSGEAQFDPETFELSSGGPNIGGIVFNLIFLAAYVAVIVLLARNSRAFVRR